MAEIPIQEKRGGSKLPLILGGLLLLLLLGWCLTRDRADTVDTDTAGVTVPADTVGGTGTAPRSDTALTPGGTRPDTGPAGTRPGTATGTTTGTATGTGTSTRP